MLKDGGVSILSQFLGQGTEAIEKRQTVLNVMLKMLAISFLLFFPDIIHGLFTGNSAFYPKIINYIIVFVVAFLVSTATNKRNAIALLVLFFTVSTSYFLFEDFFGGLMTARALKMGASDFYDVLRTFFGSFHLFVFSLTVGIGSCLAAIYLVTRTRQHFTFEYAGITMIVLLLFLPVRLFFVNELYQFTPVKTRISFIGAYSVMSSFIYRDIKDQFFPSKLRKDASFKLAALPIKKDQNGKEPLVVFLLGESIKASHMGVLGYQRDTTPRLQKMAQQKGDFALYAKKGFSYASASLPSLLQIFNMPSSPYDRDAVLLQNNNIFGLAKKQSFATMYLSDQLYSNLEHADTTHIDKIVTKQNLSSAFSRIKGDSMFPFLPKLARDKKQFLMMYQWANHSNYMSHCAHKPKGIHIYKTGRSRQGRVNGYDNGLRCYDQEVTRLMDYMTKPADRPIYIFVTADHSELLGEGGLWGHGHLTPETMLVPFMIYTNQKDSPIIKSFQQEKIMTHLKFMHLLANALGYKVENKADFTSDPIYMGSNTFDTRGPFLEMRKNLDNKNFQIIKRTPEGQILERGEVDILAMLSQKSTDVAQKHPDVSVAKN